MFLHHSRQKVTMLLSSQREEFKALNIMLKIQAYLPDHASFLEGFRGYIFYASV